MGFATRVMCFLRVHDTYKHLQSSQLLEYVYKYASYCRVFNHIVQKLLVVCKDFMKRSFKIWPVCYIVIYLTSSR